jgi:hypothetical protein
MKDLQLYKNLDELYTDERKSEIIRRVFENKAKTDLSMKKMAKGGGVDENEIYTPYEFLHELLPQVYGRNYIVSDTEAERMTKAIEKEEAELNAYVLEQLTKYNVSRIYSIDDEKLVTDIEIRRKTIASKKIFVSESELRAYLYCHPEIDSSLYLKETLNVDLKDLLAKGLVMMVWEQPRFDSNINTQINGHVKYVYRYDYLSGNLYKKITDLDRDYTDIISNSGMREEETKIHLEYQKKMLNLYKPVQAEITLKDYNRINIHPKSTFSEEIFYVNSDDWADESISRAGSLKSCFIWWMDYQMDITLIQKSTKRAIQKYFVNLEKAESSSAQNERRQAFFDGERIFPIFLNDALSNLCKARLQYKWNEMYNNYTDVVYGKIPVALTCSKKWKTGQDFLPNETQVQSVQYIKSAGSGLLAYGVGVGKTASSILNVSYAFDHKMCKKALFCVPNPTYSKWILEIKGGEQVEYVVNYNEEGKNQQSVFSDLREAKKFEKEVSGKLSEKVKVIKGILPHLPPIVELYNLGEEYVMNIKNYSDEEMNQMKNVDIAVGIVKDFDENTYTFESISENNELRKYYDDFESDRLSKEYNLYKFELIRKQEKTGKPQKIDSPKVYLLKIITRYRRELPFVLGKIKSFPDNTIFICTYEGLRYIGNKLGDSSELADNDSVFGKLFHELSQGEEVNNFVYANRPSGLSKKLEEVVYGIDDKRKLDIDELGLDYAVFDESHYFKKVYTASKGLPDKRGYGVRNDGYINRQDRKYTIGGTSDAPSSRSLQAWSVTRSIQIKNNGANVIQMTATPFTNKPSEIFSMLALTNYKRLVDSGFQYMQEFFDIFMQITFTLRTTSSQKVVRQETLNGFNNLPQMRRLIYGIMDYKSGEDANIKRPDKILYPSISEGRETSIPATSEQEVMFREIKRYIGGEIAINELCGDMISTSQGNAEDLSDSELIAYIEEQGSEAQIEKFVEAEMTDELREELVSVVQKMMSKEQEVDEGEVEDVEEKKFIRVAKGINLMKQVTLSPYLSTCSKESGFEPTATQYVNSSPKLLYTIESIKSIHDYEAKNNLQKSGIVMYMNMGVHPSFKGYKWKEGGFEKIKKYFVEKYGYNPSEISIIHGKISRTEKEKEKNKFLAGISTVLIGSSTISTGVDLQNNSSALFMCAFDWNPTDNEQIQGRIHRQGNRFAKVRIVYPMVANSSDVLIFGSLIEKTNRIKSIWDRDDKGTTLDLKDFDPTYYEKELLTDPKDRTRLWVEEKVGEISDEINYLSARIDSLRIAKDEIETYNNWRPVMISVLTVLDDYKKNKTREEGIQSVKDKRIKLIDSIEDDVQLAKELSKLKKDSYDYENDPEGRYVIDDYSNLTDEELVTKLRSQASNNVDSYWYKNFEDGYTNWENFVNFLRSKYPAYSQGKFFEDPELQVYISWTYPRNFIDKVMMFLGAVRSMKKVKEQLAILGIDFKDISSAVQTMVDNIEDLKEESRNIQSKVPEMYEMFSKEAEAKKTATPTITERVIEFAKMHEILKDQLKTFAKDRGKVATVFEEKLDIKPKKEKEVKQEKAETSERDYLKGKIESFELLLEIEDDKAEIEYLKGKIESFELLLELEEV